MSNVTQLFRTDEFTGLSVPNRDDDPLYIVLDANGKGLKCCLTRNDAIREVAVNPQAVRYVVT